MSSIVAPLAPHPLLVLFAALTVLLVLARLLGRLAGRFGLPAIVGELVTGVVLGPSILGHILPSVAHWLLPNSAEQAHLLDAVSQLSVVLLVGITGTHLDTGAIRRRLRSVLSVGLAGLLIPLMFGIGLGLILPGALAGPAASTGVFALFMGIAMCVTAIPVIAKTLTDMGLLHRNLGQLVLGASMIDDAAGWLLLSVVSAAATAGVTFGHVSIQVAYLVVFIAFASTIGRKLVTAVMTKLARSVEPGPAIAAAVVIVLVGSVITLSLGMEPIFGAFIAGVLVSQVRPVQVKLASLRSVVLSVFAPLFLATAGLRVDLTSLAKPSVAIAGVAVLAVAILGKFGGAYLGARISGLTKLEGLALGAGMNSRGVVEVVVALTGLRLGVLNTASYTIVVLVAIVTSLMAPPVLRWVMGKLELDDEERLRKIDHDTWTTGVEIAEPIG
jgi:Kef-type K+ transport system membrane component KefB